jgi:hypothetical protein
MGSANHALHPCLSREVERLPERAMPPSSHSSSVLRGELPERLWRRLVSSVADRQSITLVMRKSSDIMVRQTVGRWTHFRALLELSKEGPQGPESNGVTHFHYSEFGLREQ